MNAKPTTPSPAKSSNPHKPQPRTAGSFFGDFRTPSASETLHESGWSAME